MTPFHRPDDVPEPANAWDADVAAAEAAVRVDAHARAALSRRAFLTGAAATIPAAALLGGGGLAAAAARTSRSRARRSATASTVRGAGPAGACALPADVLTRIKRGWDPARSGQLLYVPHGWNYLDGGISHSTPWHYTQDVPMFWYGPGIIPAKGGRSTFVTSADIAPTIAKLIKFDFDAPDGSPMDEVIKPYHPKPKLVVVLVWDAGGRYVLDLHPNSWPHLKGLINKGVWFTHATVGSNPSNTAPIHATIGTGAFPRTHGVVDNTIRFEDGKLADPWGRGPSVMKVPTLADVYGKAMGSAARTAMFGTLPWHLGMVGWGASVAGGVRHIAVLKDTAAAQSGDPRWTIPGRLAQYYRFPAYVNQDLPPLSAYWKQYADAVDGKVDGTWRGHSIQAAQGGFHTPARVPFQTKAIKKVIERERLGRHEEPDLLFLNYKIIDEIGHEYFSDSPEMNDTIRIQDQFLGSLVDYLNTHLKNQWVLCLTADHGHTATPGRTGATPLAVEQVHNRLQAQFDTDGDNRSLVQIARPTGAFLNPAEVQENGTRLDAMSSYLAASTLSQVGKSGYVRPGQGGARAFDAVFGGSILPHLDCGSD